MICQVWEVYEANTDRCECYKDKETADMHVDYSVDIQGWSMVDLGIREIENLLAGGSV